MRPPHSSESEDFVTVARGLTPMEALLLESCLQACGVPARADDVHLLLAHGLLAPALGGARLSVPASHEHQARRLVAAHARGEFAIDENFDPNDQQ